MTPVISGVISGVISVDMTPVLYFLHLNTLDIILLIVNISVADDAFYK